MRAAMLFVLAALCGCEATHTMPYSPRTTTSAAVAAARPVVALLEPVTNERRAGRDDPTWIGTIRGGYGNPLKVLRADAPVEQVVARAFADRLAVRGLAAPSAAEARYTLAVTIHRFDANQFRGRTATADFSGVLTDRATGRAVWRDCHLANKTSGSFFSYALFSSVEDLRALALRAMNETVDALLDNPEFRAALKR